MFRNNQVFEVSFLDQLPFFNQDGFINIFDEDLSTPSVTDQNDSGNQQNSNFNFFDDKEPISQQSNDNKLNFIGDLKTDRFGQDEEFMILPAITNTLSTHQTQPEVVEIDDLSEELPESKETGNSQRQQERQQRNQISSQSDTQKFPIRQLTQNQEPKKSTQEMLDESGNQNSSDGSQKTKKDLPHLRLDRREKGKRNSLQKEVKGYWTNNLLRWAKKYHYDWILEHLGQKFLKNHPDVFKVFNKFCSKTGKKMEGINMTEYESLYDEEDLEKIWQLFFSKKVLYRQLMLSKTDGKLKKVYVKFMKNFERAFRTKKFVFLSKTENEFPNM